MTHEGDHELYREFYTATCTDGHAIVMHEPCGSMVLHEPSLRMDFILRASDAHALSCNRVSNMTPLIP